MSDSTIPESRDSHLSASSDLSLGPDLAGMQCKISWMTEYTYIGQGHTEWFVF